MGKYILLLLALVAACSSDIKTKDEVTKPKTETSGSSAFIKGKRQLELQGYTDIKETSYPLFCCSDGDSFWASTGFEALSETGEKVTGCFCVKKGIFRNSVTIRFN